MQEKSVDTLPDFPALKRLASALWNEGKARGAAVLVGAGFSRNADLAGPDTRPLPLWADLAAAMAESLYGRSGGSAPTDALRLAGEYRAYFGDAALTDFVREQVSDASWRPGELHRSLVALPWSEVLTTNYDTLSERASGMHGVVRTGSELSQIKGRRIIKLHGCVAAGGRLVIAEEDYRAYPSRSAAFVNTARQIFLENELCLVGFSGDDPNFLQWSGWVRDQLGGEARRIYLVGALNLSPSKRRLLEARGVTPVDFGPLTGKLDRARAERRACDLFLGYLRSQKPNSPMDWCPTGYDEYAFVPTTSSRQWSEADRDAVLTGIGKVWRSDRDSCPKWFIFPARVRQDLEFGTSRVRMQYVEASSTLPEPMRWRLLSDAAWRHHAALQAFEGGLGPQTLALALHRDATDPERVTVLRMLLAEARLQRDEATFQEIAFLLAEGVEPGSDGHADLVGQRLLWARDGLDLETVAKQLGQLQGPGPVWKALKAVLHGNCGQFDEAKRVIEDARSDLEFRRRDDPTSVHIATHAAWIDVFETALRFGSDEPGSSGNVAIGPVEGYDAWDEINRLRRDVRAERSREADKPQGLQPRFGAGEYTDHGSATHLRIGRIGEDAERVFRLADFACIPLLMGSVDLLASVAAEALTLEPQPDLNWHLRLIRVISVGSVAMDRHFGQVAVANLDPAVALELTSRIVSEIGFWRPRTLSNADSLDHHATDRLRTLLELLSRLVVRAAPSLARQVLDLGLQIARVPGDLHLWLMETSDNLLKRTLGALPPKDCVEPILDCLELPLPPPLVPSFAKWPSPVDNLIQRDVSPMRDPDDPRWSLCIGRLTAAMGDTGPARAHAANRLAYLALRGCLTDAESHQFGAELWRADALGPTGLPDHTQLYPHVLAALPSPPAIDGARVVRDHLLRQSVVLADAVGALRELVAAANSTGRLPKILPTRTEARRLLEELRNLEEQVAHNLAHLEPQEANNLHWAIGQAMANVVLPQLEKEDIEEGATSFMKSYMISGGKGAAIAGLHEFARLIPASARDVARELRRVVGRGNLVEVSDAFLSIRRWAESPRERGYPPVEELLKETVVSGLGDGIRRGLSLRIACARELLLNGLLSYDQKAGLAASLDILATDLEYSNLPIWGEEAIGLTLARAECVRCAAALRAYGVNVNAWADKAFDDPLPEVRFALPFRMLSRSGM